MTFTNLILVGLGGFAGSIARFLTGHILKGVAGNFPLGTFVVNILGSLILGIVMGLMVTRGDNEKVKLLLVTGFCGGFTTFSAFAFENFNMIDQHAATMAIIYTVSSLLAGVVAVMVGVWIGRNI